MKIELISICYSRFREIFFWMTLPLLFFFFFSLRGDNVPLHFSSKVMHKRHQVKVRKGTVLSNFRSQLLLKWQVEYLSLKKKSEILLIVREGCYPHVGNNKELILPIRHIELDLRRSPTNTLYLLLFLRNSTIPGKLVENT